MLVESKVNLINNYIYFFTLFAGVVASEFTGMASNFSKLSVNSFSSSDYRNVFQHRVHKINFLIYSRRPV